MTVPSSAKGSGTHMCIWCGADVPSKSEFCLKCGAAQPKAARSPNKCVSCGFEIPDIAKFCPECGVIQTIPPSASPVQVRPVLSEATEKSSNVESKPSDGIKPPTSGYMEPATSPLKRLLLIAVPVVVILLTVWAINTSGNHSDETPQQSSVTGVDSSRTRDSIPQSSEYSKPSAAVPAEEQIAQTDATTSTASNSHIRDAVAVWIQAFRSRDTTKLAGCYAPEMEQYFRKKNVSRSQVQQYFESSFGKIESINRYEITDLKTDILDGSTRATATFNKQWDTSQTDGKTFSGEEIERLTFAMTDEGWKIVREEELNIIRATRQ